MTLPDLETLLAELVALPSCSSADPAFDRSNRAVAERLAAWCDDLGATVEVRPAGPSDKWNVVARFGTGAGGLVLAGHTDTVPHDDTGWSSDPFRLTEREGRLHGLGATDMKGFFPAALHAIARVGVSALRAPVVIVGTADEESSMAGARRLLAEGGLPGASVVLGEPTGLVPVHLHKGVAQDRIELFGAAGHASDPANGTSALDAMVDVLEALVRHRLALATIHDPRFPVPFPTLNLGRIEGGDSANRICARCSLDVDRRLHPGATLEASRTTLAEVVREAVRDPRVRVEIRPLFEGIEAFETPADADILALAEAITGASRAAVPFGTEAPLFQAMGKPTIVLGPGDIRAAHAIDEYVPRAELHRAVDVYARLLAARCTDSAP